MHQPCMQEEFIAGAGTYVREGFIHASLVGVQRIGGDEASGSGVRRGPCKTARIPCDHACTSCPAAAAER
jgi:hypothetical protein